MKNLFLFFVIITNSIFGQDVSDAVWIARDSTATPISIISYWNKNDVKEYRFIHKKRIYEKDSLKSEKYDFNSIARFEVIDSTEKKYLINFTFKNERETDSINSEFLENTSNDFIKEFCESDIVVQYEISEVGAFLNFIDREKLIEKFDFLMDKAYDEKFKKTKIKKEEIQKIKTIYNGKYLFQTLVEVFITNFHNLHGVKMGIDDTLNFKETIVANNINILGNCYLYINSTDSSSNEVEYQIEKYYEDEVINKFMLKVSNDFFNEDTRKALSEYNWNMFIKNYSYIEIEKGWPTFINVVKEITGTKKTDEKETTLTQEYWIIDSDLTDPTKKKE